MQVQLHKNGTLGSKWAPQFFDKYGLTEIKIILNNSPIGLLNEFLIELIFYEFQPQNKFDEISFFPQRYIIFFLIEV